MLPLWQAAPFSLVNWWDMEQFSASYFWEVSRILEMFSATTLADQDGPIPETSRMATDWLPEMRKALEKLGLRLSVMSIDRAIQDINGGQLKTIDFQKKTLPEIQRRIRDEFSLQLFMHIPIERADRYDQKELLGKEVNAKFPTIQYDATEAGNCYVCRRS